MLKGILLNVTLGCIWAVVGIIMSSVASTSGSIIAFYALATTVTSILAWVLIPDWGVILSGGVINAHDVFFWVLLGGAVNAFGQIGFIQSMRRGHRASSWAVGQSAMSIPFAASILVFGDPVRWVGVTGVACVVSAIVFIALSREEKIETFETGAWIPYLIMAFVFVGMAQTFFGVPSRWEGWEDTARIRGPLSLTGAMLVHVPVVLGMRIKVQKSHLKLAGVWAAGALAAYFLLFDCLDLMTKHGLGGIVFPLGVGVCIVGFCLYTRFWLKEPFSTKQLLGVILAVTGIAQIAFATLQKTN